MIRGLFFCAIIFGIAAPATAAARDTATSAVHALAMPILPVSANFPGFEGGLTIDGAFALRIHGIPAPTLALDDFENLPMQHFNIAPVETVALVSSYAQADLRASSTWWLTDRLPPAKIANGISAVRDLLAEHRRPRLYRRSVFTTMLVLRMDGESESPVFSVGGGGVASALWQIARQ